MLGEDLGQVSLLCCCNLYCSGICWGVFEDNQVGGRL